MRTNQYMKVGKASSFALEPARKRVPALGYDNLSSVLIHLEGRADEHAKRRRDRKSSVEATEITELRAQIASLKAENDLLAERLTDEVDRLAERITELEAQAKRHWWCRVFGIPDQVPESAARPRSKAIARLRAISQNEAAAESKST
jgi:hypothetical protein